MPYPLNLSLLIENLHIHLIQCDGFCGRRFWKQEDRPDESCAASDHRLLSSRVVHGHTRARAVHTRVVGRPAGAIPRLRAALRAFQGVLNGRQRNGLFLFFRSGERILSWYSNLEYTYNLPSSESHHQIRLWIRGIMFVIHQYIWFPDLYFKKYFGCCYLALVICD